MGILRKKLFGVAHVVVLVIGGNGFIGSRLTERLRGRGVDVRILDAGIPRPDFDWQGIDYRRGSLAERGAILESLNGVNVVVHCASSTVPSTSNLDPVGDVQQNLVGAINVLEAMRQVGVGRIVYLSSGGTVYGDPIEEPIPESHELNPISSYGVVKVAIEKYLSMYRSLYGIQSVILRPSNPYGPGQLSTGVQGLIASFLGKILAGETLPIWGDGEIVRDYLYIDDLIDMLCLAVLRCETGIFNVGSGQGQSVNDIVAAIASATGFMPEIVRMEARSFDVKRVVLDVSRARDVFGWTPRTTLSDGIQLAWKWLKQSRAPE
ncbi:NAD-dependent epimerase/dehydratase family protein [Luteibacter sp. 22Crub2.1]|uniref:NAD-dependent epimerase/dehydratase family protein n=1 Tax=Luteibacter sp. 22Crub2.1 TaxID=1283288 RepID=UPI0009C764D8|nr:NAD-dependent epimerase/dehydratase family protein [Luteibacter sp. 22Crub2.1]SKC00709.1 UDP-glucose 4-epimerase [Luteibacter sp. 22Crub2.1]